MGGIVSNDAGGERTLRYGKTEKYVEEVEVVLSDGSQATFKALTPEELEEKKNSKHLRALFTARWTHFSPRMRHSSNNIDRKCPRTLPAMRSEHLFAKGRPWHQGLPLAF